MSSARVLQVNVSRGGVPKLPVEEAWVGRLGVEGDAHKDRTLHGGPHRAVCLFGIEAIERLQAEGHPTEPGGVGENLTTAGVDWSTLPVGTRAKIGQQLVLELSDSTTPCATTRRSFKDGRFSRISIDLHPADSRMYARVLEEGPVRAGDPIVVLPPAPDSRAHDELLLARLDDAAGKSSLRLWQAAAAAGHEVSIVEDGELAMASSAGLPGPAFNLATGFARLPNLIADATAFFDSHGRPGWIDGQELPVAPGPSLSLDILAAGTSDVAPADWPAGIEFRRATGADAELVEEVIHHSGSGGIEGGCARDAWPAIVAQLASERRAAVLLATARGRGLAAGMLSVHHATGWLSAAAVVPEARGQGLHRALIAERVSLARQLGCNLVGASAEPGGVASGNLQRLGFRRLGFRQRYRYEPSMTVAR